MTDKVVRGDDGLCKVVPRGQPGLLVAEINKLASFEGYAKKGQNEAKVLKVSYCLFLPKWELVETKVGIY